MPRVPPVDRLWDDRRARDRSAVPLWDEPWLAVLGAAEDSAWRSPTGTAGHRLPARDHGAPAERHHDVVGLMRHAVLVDPANFYSGIVVGAYARLKSNSFDADRYRDFVVAHGEPGLEIGCGDGHPLLALCAEGLDVEGVDSSADMLAGCRENALRRGIEVRLHHERVEDLNLGRRYPSIYFAGPTFTLLPDDRTAHRALEAIRRHLADDGMALIPLWVPDPTPAEELGVCRSNDDGLGAEVRYTPLSEKTDPVTRTRVTSTRYERITVTDHEVAEREWIIHWQTPASFRRACRESGLDVVELIDDETGSAATNDSTEFTATVCRGADRGASDSLARLPAVGGG